MLAEVWWDANWSGYIGAILGVSLGLWGAILGSVAGLSVRKGKAKGLLLGSCVCVATLGVGLLSIGGYAIFASQPYRVWYPLLLGGGLSACLGVSFYFILRTRYRQTELRKMQATELR